MEKHLNGDEVCEDSLTNIERNIHLKFNVVSAISLGGVKERDGLTLTCSSFCL